MSKREEVIFSITGAFLTNHIQNLVLEGNYIGALEILKSSNSNVEDDILYNILSGEYILNGEDSDIYIDTNPEEDENLLEYRKKLNSLVSNYKMFDAKLYKVRGYIPLEKILDGEYQRERISFYKESESEIDEIIDDKIVIFELCSIQLPYFLLESIKKEKSFDLDSIEEIIVDDSDLEYIAETKRISNYALDAEKSVRRFQAEDRFLESKREEIIEQAKENGGFFKWKYKAETYSVPLSPFLEWAKGAESIHASSLTDLNPYKWEAVLEQGWKMRSDDTNHSDWMLGAGLDFRLSYDNDFSRAATNLKFEKINEFLELQSKEQLTCLTISGDGIVTGNLKFFSEDKDFLSDDIVVIPDSSIKYFELSKKVACVIAKVGGPLSHLAINAKEHDIKAILYPDADNLEEGLLTEINLSDMKISQTKNMY